MDGTPPVTGVLVPLVAGGVAAALTLAVTPFVIRWAIARGFVAIPRADRWHRGRIALMGGLGIIAGVLPAAAITGSPRVLAMLGAVSVLSVLGLVDDRRSVSPTVKVVVETGVSAVVLALGLRFGAGLPEWLAIPLTVAWTIGISNAVNLLDNMDGLAAGVSAIISGASGVVLLLGNQPGTAALAFGTAGACAAFLAYNFNPARVFMGDCGSLFLGGLVAMLTLEASQVVAASVPVAGVVVPLALAAFPLMDTTLVIVARRRAGRSIVQGGRDHVSHRLVYTGLTEVHAVLVMYGLTLLGGIIPVIMLTGSPLAGLATFAVLCLGLFGLWLKLLAIDAYSPFSAPAVAADPTRDPPLAPTDPDSAPTRVTPPPTRRSAG